MRGSPASAVLGLAILAAGCAPPDEGRFTAIVGAVLLDGSGGPPVAPSVIVIDGGSIRAAGHQSVTPIPAGAVKIDAAGRYAVPLLIDPDSGEPRLALDDPRPPAEAIAGASRRLGVRIAPGAEASLLLLPEDPLAGLANLRRPGRVMLRGQWR